MERFSADWWLQYTGVCIRPARPEDSYEELLPGVTTIPCSWDAHNKLSQQDIRKINNLVRSVIAREEGKERQAARAERQQAMCSAGRSLVQSLTSLPKRLMQGFSHTPKGPSNDGPHL